MHRGLEAIDGDVDQLGICTCDSVDRRGGCQPIVLDQGGDRLQRRTDRGLFPGGQINHVLHLARPQPEEALAAD